MQYQFRERDCREKREREIDKILLITPCPGASTPTVALGW